MLPGPVAVVGRGDERRRRKSAWILRLGRFTAPRCLSCSSSSSWRKEQELNLRCLVSVMCAGQPGMLISGSRGQNLGEVARPPIPVVRNKSANCVMVALKIPTRKDTAFN